MYHVKPYICWSRNTPLVLVLNKIHLCMILLVGIITSVGHDIDHIYRGTGMIVSSSTFRTHPGRVIRYLFRQLHAIRHGRGP